MRYDYHGDFFADILDKVTLRKEAPAMHQMFWSTIIENNMILESDHDAPQIKASNLKSRMSYEKVHVQIVNELALHYTVADQFLRQLSVAKAD